MPGNGILFTNKETKDRCHLTKVNLAENTGQTDNTAGFLHLNIL